jgi:hypothetical protein
MSDVEGRSSLVRDCSVAASDPASCGQAVLGLVSVVTALLGIVVDAFNDATGITSSPILIRMSIVASEVIIEPSLPSVEIRRKHAKHPGSCPGCLDRLISAAAWFSSSDEDHPAVDHDNLACHVVGVV